MERLERTTGEFKNASERENRSHDDHDDHKQRTAVRTL